MLKLLRRYNRYHFLGFVLLFFALVLIGRLFFIQVISTNEYKTQAKEQHMEGVELHARRGEILLKDEMSGNYSKLATNMTLDLLYVDPIWIDDPNEVSNKLSSILYDFFCSKIINMSSNAGTCLERTAEFIDDDPILLEGIEEDDLRKKIELEIYSRISEKEVQYTVLKYTSNTEVMDQITEQNFRGIYIGENLIYANPVEISENEKRNIASVLSKILEKDEQKILAKLNRRPLRYVPLVRRLDPDLSQRIREFEMKGVVLLPEHWRYYPEGEIASQLVGFVDHEGVGRYGIEESFDSELVGKKGEIFAEMDPFGRQIIIGGQSKIRPAVDGSSILLTIDRILQAEVEKILEQAVKDYKANSGQVIVMDPYTGHVLVMANWPTFDPNKFGDVYEVKDYAYYPGKGLPVLKKDTDGNIVPAYDEDINNDDIDKFLYKNRFGPGNYYNNILSGSYEPGSVFKPFVMAAAIDAGEITPQTMYYDSGELKVDEYVIHNATDECIGRHNMIHVLNYSCNIGMSFIAKKLGRGLMYKYVIDYGFSERTYIDLIGESKGKVKYYRYWSDSRLLNTSFGQGLSATPLQMATAYSALANRGLLMKPIIVDMIIDSDGNIEKNEPEVVKRVISEDAADTITSMLISATEKGVAKNGKVPGFYVAGKTGTSQIASRGVYEKGEGTTIATFAGYAPANDPKYVMLVKLDRPRTTQWASSSAAPLFSEISAFILNYYNIPPERN